MRYTARIAILAMFTLLWTTVAMAAPKTFMVAPFMVQGGGNYNYLGKAVPSTLSSRMNWPGHVVSANSEPTKPILSPAEAKNAIKAGKVDYMVWGKITVSGDNATINAIVSDANGREWKQEVNTPVADLVGAVQTLSDGLSQKAFGRTINGKSAFNQMNQDIVVNETGSQEVYLNPQFRYQGSGTEDGSRLRCRPFDYKMVDFAIGDFVGDGTNQVVTLSDHKLYLYRWDNGKMQQLLEHTIAMADQNFTLRSIRLTKGRASQVVVATFDEENNRASSYIYSLEGGTVREFCKRSPYFLSVVRLAPTFMPTLVAQMWDSVNLFRPGVYMANIVGDRVTLGSKIALPKGANVFNFAYLPGGKDSTSDKLVLLGPSERIKVFSVRDLEDPIYETSENYSGSSVGMEHYKTMDGLGIDTRYQLPDKYYAPMRMLSVDLEGRGEYVLLMNKPISTAAQFFDRYRYFPQGEVHALYWDGVGLGLKWKTRRIRGSVVDVALGDLDNNGVLDLIVGLNTHPGSIGIGKRKGVITAYPLDITSADPNTPAYREYE